MGRHRDLTWIQQTAYTSLYLMVHKSVEHSGFFFISLPNLQFSLLITGCVNPTPTTRAVTTLAFTAHASRTTRPTCSAVITTTRLSSTAATRLSSRLSCRSTSPPPQTDTHTSELQPLSQILTRRNEAPKIHCSRITVTAFPPPRNSK